LQRGIKIAILKMPLEELFLLQKLRPSRIREMPQPMNSIHSEPDVLPLKPIETILLSPPSPKSPERRIARKRTGRLFGVLGHFFNKEKKEADGSDEEVLDLAQKYPENAAFQLKLAEVYQRKGEEEKAIARYLQAGEIFCREKFVPQAMAIYKRIISINPHLIHANQRMGEMYREMGHFSDAIAQYRIVAKHYEQWGKKERVPGVLRLIQEIEREETVRIKTAAPCAKQEAFESQAEQPSLPPSIPIPPSPGPQKGAHPDEKECPGFDLVAELVIKDFADPIVPKEVITEKISGFEEIFKELRETVIPAEVYPDFNLQMGKACMEMGFNDGAIEQFQLALEKGQNPGEAARLLSKCYREKGWLHEARKCYEKSMDIESNNQARNPTPKSEPSMVSG